VWSFPNFEQLSYVGIKRFNPSSIKITNVWNFFNQFFLSENIWLFYKEYPIKYILNKLSQKTIWVKKKKKKKKYV